MLLMRVLIGHLLFEGRMPSIRTPVDHLLTEGKIPSIPRRCGGADTPHLPHFEAGEVPQHVWIDSLPQHLLQQWERELKGLPEAEHHKRRRIEEALDQGHGACWLRRPEIAALVREILRWCPV